ncbi:hypothetical protein [Methylophilus sp.]|jgi:hypothetical protein|uniref:hypothetical protein n=1 Tax=Methylophilus sp. TaxID=29541 RepID=UPI0011D9E41A|nr:hypothetical protein [Methylophilus sp.]TXI44816.1 MAG: hypothetical protein E6Q52_08070 [Methylophilus sp.]
MDTFSHALWGYGLFGFRKYPKFAALMGAMPDLISFGALLLLRVIEGNYSVGKPALVTLPAWIYPAYTVGHSFVIAFAVIGLVAVWRKDLAFAMLAWPFHITLDFPFHSLQYFATPMFWPISDFKVDGIPWSHWYIWWPNVAGIIILLAYRYRQKRQAS